MPDLAMDKIERGFHMVAQGLKEKRLWEKNQIKFVNEMSDALKNTMQNMLNRGPIKKD